MPAPGSTAISTPSALNFLIESGEAATRGSDGSISLATAIFMGPPAGAGRARKQTGAHLVAMDAGRGRQACNSFHSRNSRRPTARIAMPSGQENRHHGKDENDGGRAVFHQHDKTF